MLARIAFILIFSQTCRLRLPFELAMIACLMVWIICGAAKPRDFMNPIYTVLFLSVIYTTIFSPTNSTMQKLVSPIHFGVRSSQQTAHCPAYIKQKPYWKIYGCSLLFGDRSQLPIDLKASLQKIGMSHILAISGLHFGVMFFTFKFILHFFVGFLAIIFGHKCPPHLMHRLKSILLMLICIYYYFMTSRSPASFRACTLLIATEGFCLLGFHTKFIDLLAGVFVFTGLTLNHELLSIGNMLSWSCYLTVFYFYQQKSHPLTKNLKMYACLTLIGASFFMKFNLLSPVLNMVFLPTFMVLFAGLILTFILASIIDVGEYANNFVVKHIENYFILLDEWTFFKFRHFQIEVESPPCVTLLPLLTLVLLGYFTYRLENQPARTLIDQ